MTKLKENETHEGFSVKDFVEPQTGIARRIYSYKRKPCRRVLLNSRLCNQLAGYTLIEKDLRSVLTWLSEIENRHTEIPTRKGEIYGRGADRSNYNLIKGLFVAALTLYGKCFTKCEGRPVKLERAQLDEQFHRLHDECIAYRHNFAAHIGAKKLEYVEIALVSPIKYKEKVNFRIYQELYQPDLFWPSPGDITLTQLVEHTRLIAKQKCELLVEKIEREEVKPNAEKYWQAK